MNQTLVMRLLEEAVTARGQRGIEIHNQLAHQVYGSTVEEAEDVRGQGLQVLLNEIFVSTLKHDPRLLPMFFPVFAILCGDRDDSIIAEIEWNVFDTFQNRRNAAKAAPAIYRFESVPWGWVMLEELAEVLGYMPSEVLDRYGALSKDAARGILAVTTGNVVENISISNLVAIAQDRESSIESHFGGTFYVPAGWAMDVVKAAAQGYNRVTLQSLYLGEEDSDPSWLSMTHNTGFDNQFWVAVGHKD